MTKRGAIFFFLCLLSVPLQSQEPSVLGAWRQSGIKWKEPPTELHSKEHYAESALFFFDANHKFALVYGTVIQDRNSEGISHGDGQVVYLGTWEVDGAVLHIKYRLVSRTISKTNETIPGPMGMGEIEIKKDALLFEQVQFRRDRRLDKDLRDILQGEGARMKALNE